MNNGEEYVEFDLTQALSQSDTPADPGPDPLQSLPTADVLVSMGVRQFLNLLHVCLSETGRRGSHSTALFQQFLLSDAMEAILRLGEGGGDEGELGEELIITYLVMALNCPSARSRRAFATKTGPDDFISWTPFFTRLFDVRYGGVSYSVPSRIRTRGRAIAARLGGAWLTLATMEDILEFAAERPLWLIESLFHIPTIARIVTFDSAQGAIACRDVAREFIDV